MRAFSLRLALPFLAAAVTLSSASGCTSMGNWSMPTTNWFSWSKPKKPADSAVAAKTAPTAPPSRSFAPSATGTAAVPSSQPNYAVAQNPYGNTGYTGGAYSAAAHPATGGYPSTGYTTQPTGGYAAQPAAGYDTGRYATATGGAQKGFYNDAYNPTAARAAGSYSAAPTTNYGAPAYGTGSPAGYTAPAGYNAQPGGYPAPAAPYNAQPNYGAPPAGYSAPAPAPTGGWNGAAAPTASGGGYASADTARSAAPEAAAQTAPSAGVAWNTPAAGGDAAASGGYRPGSISRYEAAPAGDASVSGTASTGGTIYR